MPNRVFLREDKIIHQILGKDNNAKALQEDLEILLQLQEELKAQRIPLKILLDSTHVTTSDSETRKQGVHNLDQLNYKKIAIYGPNAYVRYMINFVLFATGKKKRIRIFETMEQALEWLKRP